ncbi:unnamed protein product, partial [Ectocarpus sp. 12 AP-2014]
ERWTEQSGRDGFQCCLHYGSLWCPCKNRTRVRTGPVPVLDRSTQAKTRHVRTS